MEGRLQRARVPSSMAAATMSQNLVAVAAFVFFLLLISPGSSEASSEALDSLLQAYAYSAFGRHPRTGRIYGGAAPANLTGVAIAAVRLRSGSLRSRGVASFKEFSIPVGVVVHPYIERLVIVYQNLGNWSSSFFPLPGYSYLAPVLGLLAYDASNLSAMNPPSLDFEASESPIIINFQNAAALPVAAGESPPRCVLLDPNGTPVFSELVSGGLCLGRRPGHFSVVVNSPAPLPPPPAGPAHGGVWRKVWKIVGCAAGGSAGLVLLCLLLLWLMRCRRKKKLAEMAINAREGEAFRSQRVGNARLPAASTTRTPAILEGEHFA